MSEFQPSRHLELDLEFYEERSMWPLGSVLFVKRFAPLSDGTVRPEFGRLVKTGDKGVFVLIREGQSGGTAMSVDQIVEGCWEVD